MLKPDIEAEGTDESGREDRLFFEKSHQIFSCPLVYSGILPKGLFGLFCIFWYTVSRYIYSFLFPGDIAWT
jgi:hypothetical protein